MRGNKLIEINGRFNFRDEGGLSDIEIYDEELFKELLPNLEKICREKLGNEEWTFGQCISMDQEDEISVIYNADDNEDRCAVLDFTWEEELIRYDLNNID